MPSARAKTATVIAKGQSHTATSPPATGQLNSSPAQLTPEIDRITSNSPSTGTGGPADPFGGVEILTIFCQAVR